MVDLLAIGMSHALLALALLKLAFLADVDRDPSPEEGIVPAAPDNGKSHDRQAGRRGPGRA